MSHEVHGFNPFNLVEMAAYVQEMPLGFGQKLGMGEPVSLRSKGLQGDVVFGSCFTLFN